MAEGKSYGEIGKAIGVNRSNARAYVVGISDDQKKKRRENHLKRLRNNWDGIQEQRRKRYHQNGGREKGAEWASANPDKRHRSRIKCKYGIAPDEHDRMVIDQSGSCAVCLEKFTKRPAVDHCHGTGNVRALLCHNCNSALGMARENQNILRRLANYVDYH